MKYSYHESAKLHTTGKVVYTLDIPHLYRELKGLVVTSPVAHGRLKSFDFSQALHVPGVVAILSHKDIPGHKYISFFEDWPILAIDEINFIGQALFLIAAENFQAAFKAAKLIKFEIEPLKPIVTIEQSMQKDWKLAPTRVIQQGNPDEAFKQADIVFETTFTTGAQEHWYLETHAAIAVPGEGQEMKIYSSTQNPTEVQMDVARALGVQYHEIEVETKRLGGGFGGKESQGSNIAVWAALLANKTKRPVRMFLDRQLDQISTGKRHPFLFKNKIGITKDGKIIAAVIDMHGNAGAYSDLSMPILERAMLHAENSYYIPNIRITGTMWRTNLPPNTAFRGFGGPQAIANIEYIMSKIAYITGKDPAIIRKLNFYSEGQTTPYGQTVELNRLHTIYDQIIDMSNYFERKQKIAQFNKQHKFIKRGIALDTVKYGISFTSAFLNQAGALVNVYTDGSILINHGGVEMGQGLHTKILEIAYKEFGVTPDKIKINATNTSKVPNTSPTAASTGSDLNGAAVKDAIDKIKKRMAEALAGYFNQKDPSVTSSPDDFVFENNQIYDKKHPERTISFAEAAQLMRLLRVSLSATGFYRTPGLYFDREKGKGHPFYYYAYGMAVTEVEVNLLTGHVRLLRTDILHDVGDSLHPNIDRGQIEGAYIQGVGWTLLEDCRYSPDGHLLNNSPSTYKIPAVYDIPEIFNVTLLKDHPQPGTIRRSKAVGEPPFMHGLSAWLAVFDALASINDYKQIPDFNIPATQDKIALIAAKLLNFKVPTAS